MQQAVWEARCSAELASRAAALCDVVAACWRSGSALGVVEVLVEVGVPGAATRTLGTEGGRLLRQPGCDTLARLLFEKGRLTAAHLRRPRGATVRGSAPVAPYPIRVAARQNPEAGVSFAPSVPPEPSEPSAPLGHRSSWDRVLPVSTAPMRASVVKSIAGRLARVVGKEGGLTLLEPLARHATALEEELQPRWAELSELLPFLARFARGRCILEALVVRESSLQRAVADALRRKSGGRPRKPLESVGAAAEVWHHFADACVVVPRGADCDAATSLMGARCFLKGRVAFHGDEGVAWVPVAAGPSHLEWCLVWSAAPRLRWKPGARDVRHLRQGGVCVSSPPLAVDGCSFVISLLRDEAGVVEKRAAAKRRRTRCCASACS